MFSCLTFFSFALLRPPLKKFISNLNYAYLFIHFYLAAIKWLGFDLTHVSLATPHLCSPLCSLSAA